MSETQKFIDWAKEKGLKSMHVTWRKVPDSLEEACKHLNDTNKAIVEGRFKEGFVDVEPKPSSLLV